MVVLTVCSSFSQSVLRFGGARFLSSKFSAFAFPVFYLSPTVCNLVVLSVFFSYSQSAHSCCAPRSLLGSQAFCVRVPCDSVVPAAGFFHSQSASTSWWGRPGSVPHRTALRSAFLFQSNASTPSHPVRRSPSTAPGFLFRRVLSIDVVHRIDGHDRSSDRTRRGSLLLRLIDEATDVVSIDGEGAPIIRKRPWRSPRSARGFRIERLGVRMRRVTRQRVLGRIDGHVVGSLRLPRRACGRPVRGHGCGCGRRRGGWFFDDAGVRHRIDGDGLVAGRRLARVVPSSVSVLLHCCHRGASAALHRALQARRNTPEDTGGGRAAGSTGDCVLGVSIPLRKPAQSGSRRLPEERQAGGYLPENRTYCVGAREPVRPPCRERVPVRGVNPCGERRVWCGRVPAQPSTLSEEHRRQPPALAGGQSRLPAASSAGGERGWSARVGV